MTSLKKKPRETFDSLRVKVCKQGIELRLLRRQNESADGMIANLREIIAKLEHMGKLKDERIEMLETLVAQQKRLIDLMRRRRVTLQ